MFIGVLLPVDLITLEIISGGWLMQCPGLWYVDFLPPYITLSPVSSSLRQ